MRSGFDTLTAELKRGRTALSSGRLKEALEIGADLITQDPDDPRGWQLLSNASLAAGNLPEAIRCIEGALRLRPLETVYRVQLGRCLAMAGCINEALDAISTAEKYKPTGAVLLDGIGAVYSLCDEQARALTFFEKAVAVEPNPYFLYNLATAQRMTGHLKAAEATCDRVIDLDPHDYRAYYTRADLRLYTAEHNHIEQMAGLLEAGTKHWRGEVLARFAIAKECEDIGNHRRSFEHLKKGADLQRKHIRYSVDNDIGVIDKIIDTHTSSALQSKSGSNNSEPIFVLGLPRTGTTLVERILGSHSDVHSMGELNSFPLELQKAVVDHMGGKQVPKLEMVERTLELDHTRLGDAYVAATRPRTGHTSCFIDKMPQNFLYCGLIHAALPNAKIVHLTRNPMDTCYAIYKAYFTGAYPFSYDLKELGQYYTAYQRLMRHWRGVLGDTILDVSYEALVDDQENQTRRLLEYCGLEWQDPCLQFHESTAPSGTASAAQVRRPIYRSSVGRWRNYESELAPLKDFLEAAGIGSSDKHGVIND